MEMRDKERAEATRKRMKGFEWGGQDDNTTKKPVLSDPR